MASHFTILSVVRCDYFVACIAVYAVYKIFIYPRFLSPLRNVPGPPIGHALLGQLDALHGPHVGDQQQEWFKKYGSIVRITAPLGMERLVIQDSEALLQILDHDWQSWDKAPYITAMLKYVAGSTGIMTTYGAEHYRLRKLLNPAFSLANISAQSEMYHEPIAGFLDQLSTLAKSDFDTGGVVPVADWLGKIALDIMCKTVFGYECDSVHNDSEPLAEAYYLLKKVQTGSNVLKFFLLTCLPGGEWLVTSDWTYRHRAWFKRLGNFPTLIAYFGESTRIIRRIATEMIHEKVSEASDVRVDRKDVTSILVHARQNDLLDLSDSDLVDQVLNFMTGGHETVSAGCSSILWFLANDQSRQQKLREEISHILTNGRPDYRRIKSLSYLDAVVHEALRIITPLPTTTRMANKTLNLRGITVPKGTHVHVCYRNVGTWEGRWGDDAEEFNPERWFNLPENYDPVFSRFMFGHGVRACIGKNMGLMAMKALVISVVSRFSLAPAYEGQQYCAEHVITHKPADGLPLKLKELNF